VLQISIGEAVKSLPHRFDETVVLLDSNLRHQYAATLRPSGEYRLKIPYRTDEELDKAMVDLLQHIAFEADLRNCFSESNAQLEGSQDRTW
jgi:hypothetical protein